VSRLPGRRALALVLLVWTALAVNASVLTPLFEAWDETATLQALSGRPGRPLLADSLGLGAAPPVPRLLYAAGALLLDLDEVRFLPRPDAAAAAGRPACLHGADELVPFVGPARRAHLLRLLPILLGVLTLLLTARLAERLRAGSGALAAALLGCSPAVLTRFTSLTSHAVVLCASVFALLMLVRLARADGARARDGLLAGLALGAAQLCAPAAVCLAAVVPVALLLRSRREPGWRGAIVALDWVLLGLLPLAGPYWAYNLVHVGGPWGVLAPADAAPPPGVDTSLVSSVLTRMTGTVAAGAPLGAVWAGVAIAALVGLALAAVTRRAVSPPAGAPPAGAPPRVGWTALALLAAAVLIDVAARFALGGVPAFGPADGSWPHLGLSAAAALLPAGLLALVPASLRAARVLPAGLAAALALLAFRAQTHELGPAFWPPVRANDAHFMAFDPLFPVPAERRLPTIRWIGPKDEAQLPAAPVLSWQTADGSDARFTVHITSPGLASVLATYESRGLSLRDRYEIPTRFWDKLPPGVPVVCRVLRLPTLDEALAAAPGRLNVDQSQPLTLRRALPKR
jgi:hypothetical protein